MPPTPSFCPNCGAALSEGWSYCYRCGKAVENLHEPPRAEAHAKTSGETVAKWVVCCLIVVVMVLGVAIGASSSRSDESPPVYEEYTVSIVNGDFVQSSYGDGVYHGGYVTVWVVMEPGHVFGGWYDSDGVCLSTDTIYIFQAKTITLYPRAGENVEVTIMMGLGIESATGGGTYVSGSSPVLTATLLTGYSFKGWYSVDEDDFVSEKASGKVNIGNGGIIAAVSDSERYIGSERLTVSPKNHYDSCYWIVTDHWTGNFVASAKDSSSLDIEVAPGRYDIKVTGTVSGTEKTESFSKTLDGTIVNEYHYKYDGEPYGITWTVDYSVIDGIYSKKVNRHPGYDGMKAFVEYKMATVVKLAEVLGDQCSALDDVGKANFVLSFVQQVTAYERDDRYNGQSEYWKYPAETLFDRRGDCEDTSVLYCAIMKAMGYDVVLLVYTGDQYKDRGHAAAGVALASVPGGTYYEKWGNRYYYCETTSDTMRVGDNWDDYDEGRLIRIRWSSPRSALLNTAFRCATMPYCNSCGGWNPEGSAYCSGCGSALTDATEKFKFPGAGDPVQPAMAGDAVPTAKEAFVRSRVIGAVLLAAGLIIAVYGTFFLQMSVESMDFHHDLPFDSATAYELLAGGARGFSGVIPNALLILFVIGGVICTAAGFLHSSASRIGAAMIIIGTFMTFLLSYPLDVPEGTVYVDLFVNIFPRSPLMMLSFFLVVVSSHFTSTAEKLRKRTGLPQRSPCKGLSHCAGIPQTCRLLPVPTAAPRSDPPTGRGPTSACSAASDWSLTADRTSSRHPAGTRSMTGSVLR